MENFVILNGKVRFDGNCSETRAYCGAVCCRNTIILLTEEEVASGEYDVQEPTDNCNCQACQTMRATGKKALPRNDGGCIYLDGAGQCSIYDKRPQRCQDYHCSKTWWNLSLMARPKDNV